MDQPLVTVIIPAFNAAEYLKDTLQSVENQTYQNLQIIVVDDGSTDDTARIVQSYSPQVTYIHQPNSGGCAAPRNCGLHHAQGELVTFFDADDIMLPDKIESQVEDLLSQSSAVMSICNYRNFVSFKKCPDHFSTCQTLQNYMAGKQVIRISGELCRSILLEENFGSACSPLFKTSVVRDLQGFNESLFACEDFHLIYRAAMHGDIVITSKVGFERRLHDTNMSNDNERMLRNLIASRHDLSLNETNTALQHHLKHRVRRYRRDLQTCLVLKKQLSKALKLYGETFPPQSLSDLNHDVRQGIKIALHGLAPGKFPDRQH